MRMPRLANGLMPLLLVAALPACERIGQAEPPTDAAPVAPQSAVVQGVAPGAKGVVKTCQNATFRVTRHEPASGAGASATTLQILNQNGEASDIAKPGEMGDYSAVGLGCAIAASDGKPYFIVQYGELPFGCEFCEWFSVRRERRTAHEQCSVAADRRIAARWHAAKRQHQGIRTHDPETRHRTSGAGVRQMTIAVTVAANPMGKPVPHDDEASLR